MRSNVRYSSTHKPPPILRDLPQVWGEFSALTSFSAMHSDGVILYNISDLAIYYNIRYHLDQRRGYLNSTTRGMASAYRVCNAQILLNVDTNAGDGNPLTTDTVIASYFHCYSKTISNVRKRLFKWGLEGVLLGPSRATPRQPPDPQRREEDSLITLACNTTLEGR